MAKEEQINLEKRLLYNTINDLSFQLERHDTQIRHLERIVAELGKKNKYFVIPRVTSQENVFTL